MRKLAVIIMTGAAILLFPSAASAATNPASYMGGAQIAWTTWGTNCHNNVCTGYGNVHAQIVFVEASNFWSVVKCAAGVGFFVAGNWLLIAKAKKVGGVYKAAKRIVKAKSKHRKITAVRDIFGYVLGTGAVVEACT